MMRNKFQLMHLKKEFPHQNQGRNSIDQINEAVEDEAMEARNPKLVTDVNTIKADLALIKSNYATRSDLAAAQTELRSELSLIKANYVTKGDLAAAQAELRSEITLAKAELRAEIAEAKTAIIMWVVSAIFIAQLIPTLLKKFGL